MAAKDKPTRFHALPRRQRLAARAILIRGLRHEALDIDLRARRGGARGQRDERCREAIRTLLACLNFDQDDDQATLFQFRETEFDGAAPTQLRAVG
jgi:hypothetical protein